VLFNFFCGYRLASFLEEWPHLEQWFNKFCILTCVNGTAPQEDVIMEVERIIEQTVNVVIITSH